MTIVAVASTPGWWLIGERLTLHDGRPVPMRLLLAWALVTSFVLLLPLLWAHAGTGEMIGAVGAAMLWAIAAGAGSRHAVPRSPTSRLPSGLRRSPTSRRSPTDTAASHREGASRARPFSRHGAALRAATPEAETPPRTDVEETIRG